ncbi:HPP family protein [Streptomyces sp. KL118A]|uniref:HPP family protein n=1 Tax=Streptomyces sp. KL118A TaxID=3045153 RepID=UPI00278C4E96|nr:HPP family protein [Streptomyces sp. KL118A]
MSTDEIIDTQPVAVSPAAPVSADRPSPRTRSRLLSRLLAGRAPAPPSPGAALHNVSAATAVLLALVAIGSLIHEPVLIPPLAASAAIIHGAPGLPLAQPRSVIAGHLLCAAVGYAVLAASGSSPWAAALAAGISLAVMTVARTPHSPACATAVVIVLNTPRPATFVPLLVGSAGLLVLAGWAASYARAGTPRYPVYWW